jgi:hypothetical protein
MGRHTGNREVVQQLQNSLQAFLDDHRSHAQEDPEWLDETAGSKPEEIDVGCGCDDCLTAGQLLGRIY